MANPTRLADFNLLDSRSEPNLRLVQDQAIQPSAIAPNSSTPNTIR
jgi:hypothetical protein